MTEGCLIEALDKAILWSRVPVHPLLDGLLAKPRDDALQGFQPVDRPEKIRVVLLPFPFPGLHVGLPEREQVLLIVRYPLL